MNDLVIPEIIIPGGQLFLIFIGIISALVLVLGALQHSKSLKTLYSHERLQFVVLAILGTILLFIAAIALFNFLELTIWYEGEPNNRHENARNYAVTLSAILAVPFVIWRAVVAQQQADTAVQGLITDRISKAVEQLGAEKTTRTQLKNSNGKKLFETNGNNDIDYKKPIFSELTEPNIEVRLGAIYALERIANDSSQDHTVIMEMLCAYIRENSRERDAIHSLHEVFTRLMADTKSGQGLNAEQAYKHSDYINANHYGWKPTELTSENLKTWARGLPNPREDIQAALTVIGRRSPKNIAHETYQGFNLDISGCNLQKASLFGNFDNANFSKSRLDGAQLSGNFSKVKAVETSMQCLAGKSISANNVDFSISNLNLAVFGQSTMDGSRFWFCEMKQTNFNGASLIGTDWYEAKPTSVYFHQDANMSWSRLQYTDTLEIRGLEDGPTENLFGDKSVRNSEHIENKFKYLPKAYYAEMDFRKVWEEAKRKAGLP